MLCDAIRPSSDHLPAGAWCLNLIQNTDGGTRVHSPKKRRRKREYVGEKDTSYLPLYLCLRILMTILVLQELLVSLDTKNARRTPGD